MAGGPVKSAPVGRLRLAVPLWLRLGLPISLTIALAIGLISFLNYYNYEKTYKQLNVLRITVVARELREAIETLPRFALVAKMTTALQLSICPPSI